MLWRRSRGRRARARVRPSSTSWMHVCRQASACWSLARATWLSSPSLKSWRACRIGLYASSGRRTGWVRPRGGTCWTRRLAAMSTRSRSLGWPSRSPIVATPWTPPSPCGRGGSRSGGILVSCWLSSGSGIDSSTCCATSALCWATIARRPLLRRIGARRSFHWARGACFRRHGSSSAPSPPRAACCASGRRPRVRTSASTPSSWTSAVARRSRRQPCCFAFGRPTSSWWATTSSCRRVRWCPHSCSKGPSTRGRCWSDAWRPPVRYISCASSTACIRTLQRLSARSSTPGGWSRRSPWLWRVGKLRHGPSSGSTCRGGRRLPSAPT
mmetsp:Transcript_6446/g.24056  ORF Transcript_6446/g.24056 Transcript_6446/m.24056 type:complete len:327 (-) Transcript_6446:632-1612(-)